MVDYGPFDKLRTGLTRLNAPYGFVAQIKGLSSRGREALDRGNPAFKLPRNSQAYRYKAAA